MAIKSESVVGGFHRTIIDTAEAKLKRTLTDQELSFVTCRGGFIALEMILNTVSASSPEEVERYLNREFET